jgi:hypothetical protein
MKLLIIALALAFQAAQQSTPPQPSQQDLDKLRQEQQRQEAIRAQQEAQRQREEAARRERSASLAALAPIDIAKSAAPQSTERCLSQAMPEDAAFSLSSIPLTAWLAAKGADQIPWKIEIGKPELRMDQRYEIAYSGRIQSKDMHWSEDAQELITISGGSSPDGKWLIQPKAGSQIFRDRSAGDFPIRFADCLFVRPGDYVFWMAIYDRGTDRHNLVNRRIRVPEFSNDPLPNLNTLQPVVEFPQPIGPDPRAPTTIPGPLVLPVSNKRPLAVELVSIVSPADQWSGRPDIIRWSNNRVLAVTGILSQMKLANGSLAVSALDLINRKTPFEQRTLLDFNWSGLAGTLVTFADNSKVDLPALQTLKQRSSFFRESLEERLAKAGDSLRVIILVSGSLIFEQGSDLTPMKVEGDCRCRIYHFRFRLNNDDVFDDLEKLMKPLRPKTFDVRSPRDLRKALGELVRDLESL